MLDASWSKNTLLNLDQGRAAAADARHSDEHRNSMDTDAITKAVTSLVKWAHSEILFEVHNFSAIFQGVRGLPLPWLVAKQGRSSGPVSCCTSGCTAGPR